MNVWLLEDMLSNSTVFEPRRIPKFFCLMDSCTSSMSGQTATLAAPFGGFVLNGGNTGSLRSRLGMVHSWQVDGGVLLTGFEGLKRLIRENAHAHDVITECTGMYIAIYLCVCCTYCK